jgi:hypothetical protein
MLTRHFYARRLRAHFDDEAHARTSMLASYCDWCAGRRQVRVVVDGQISGQACYNHLSRVMYELIQANPGVAVHPEFKETKRPPRPVIVN